MKKMLRMLCGPVGMLVVAFLLAAVPRASADVVSFYLSVPNDGFSGYCNPYCGTVTLTDNGSSGVNVDVSMSSGYTIFGKTSQGNVVGGNNAFGFNVAGGTSNLVVSGLDPNLWTPDLSGGSLDGFGKFDVVLHDGEPIGHSSVSFTVSRTDGTVTISDLGGSFAAHVCALNGSGGCAATGFASTDGNPVPEPGTLVLLGSGLLSLGGYMRRRMKRV